MTQAPTTPRLLTVVSYAFVALLALGIAGFVLAGSVGAQTTGPNFQVTIDSTNSPVTEGETMEVTATIENTGTASDTQEVTLDIGGAQRDSTEVTLEPGNQTTTTLSWATGSGDAGDYTAAVATANDTAETDVTVEEPSSNFKVHINSTNSPVTENDTLTAEVIIENTGDKLDNQEISLSADGEIRDNVTVALDVGARQTRTLEWDTEGTTPGDYTIEVASEDDTDTEEVTINDVSNFDVEIDSTNQPVAEGDTLEIEAIVENTDTARDTQEIELEVGGKVRDTATVELGGGDDAIVDLTWETETGDAGDYQANVSSDTDNDSVDVLVNAPPSATFSRDPATPDVNQAVTFDASDSSDRDGTIVDYEWTVDGDVVATSESFSYTFTEAGDHEVTLVVTDDEGASANVSRTVTVNAPPEVSIGDVDATVGEEVTVEATASDDGTISRYEWSVDGEVVSTSETLTYTFDTGGTHRITLRVTDDDGATTATTKTVTVAGGATPTATPTPTATATASPPAEVQPGFGAALAIVALLATVLLARRRT